MLAVVFGVLAAADDPAPVPEPPRVEFPCGSAEVWTSGRICVPLDEIGGGGIPNPAPEIANPGRICVSAGTDDPEWTACGYWRGDRWEVVRAR